MHEWQRAEIRRIEPRFYAGDSLDLGLMYMKYEIPGGRTTWSGEGFKVDLSYRY